MFLLPFLAVGLVFAVVLGGRISRLAEIPFRQTWTVFAALGMQVVLFSHLGEGLGDGALRPLHIATYALLVVFAIANVRMWALAPVLLGLVLNAVAITANGGEMPVSEAAAREVGLAVDASANVSEHADRLSFLGDVFAIPSGIPLANVFSIGDVLIGIGTAAFVVYIALHEQGRREVSGARLVRPLRRSSYRRLAAGKLVSQIGDWVTVAAVVGWIYQTTGSTLHVAAVLLVRLAPPILGGGIAAIVVDRLPKGRLLVAVELARGCAVAVALAGVLGGGILLVFVALAASGALAAISAATVPALIPTLLPTDELPAANAMLGISKDVAMAIGALGAGLALSSVGVAPALMADVLTFAVAAALFRGLVVPAGTRAERPSGGYVRGGFVYLLRRRRLAVLVGAFATATLATGLTQASLPRFLETEAGFGPGAFGFGMAALAAGLVLGEALVGVSSVGATAGRWIGAALVVMAATLAVLGLSDHGPTVLFLLGAIGFLDGTTDVLFETIVQREADPERYGSVFGFAYALMAATMTGAFALAPLFNSLLDPSTVLVSAAAFLACAGGIALAGMRAASPPAPVAVPGTTAEAPG